MNGENQVPPVPTFARASAPDDSAEQSLRGRHEVLQTIIDHIPVMITFISADGKTEFVNREWERVLGWSLGEARARDVLTHMYPDPAERQRVLDFALRPSGAWGRFSTRTKDGRALETEWANVMLSDGRSIGIGKDVTEQRRAERALASNERYFRALVEDASDLIVVLNGDGTMRYVSPAAQRTFGWKPEDLIGRSALDLVYPEDLETAVTVAAQVMRDPGNAVAVALRGWHRDGRVRHLEIAVVNLISDPAVQGVIANVRDVSRRMRAQAERDELFTREQQARAEAEAARDRLRSLSRKLVETQETERRRIALELHDQIGQDLTGLRMLLDSRETSPAECLAGAQRLVDGLIERVRGLALDLRPAMLDHLGLLPAVLWQLERYTSQTGVRVDFEHAGLNRRLAPAAETAAYRILQEGLTNVARHAGVDRAAVRIAADAATFRMTIEDDGCGFDTSDESRPSIGLTGMSERAMLLGGSLRLDAAPGAGTRITVEFPVAQRTDATAT